MQTSVPATPGAASPAPVEQYYVARFLKGDYAGPLSALIAYGFEEERAQDLILEAHINGSEAIVTAWLNPAGKEQRLVVTPSPKNRARWIVALADLTYFDTEREAVSAMREIRREPECRSWTLGVMAVRRTPSLERPQ